jgi:hypothetical protein
MKGILVTAAAALALAASSAAASAPAVPPFVQKLVAARAGDLAYVPTRLPFRYRYRAYRYDAATGMLTLRFVDVRFANAAKHTLFLTAEPFGGAFETCGDGRQKTLQMGGNKVYWDGGVAWRCQRTSGGRIVKLLASGPGLPDVALGRVVASAKHVG